MPPWSHQGTSPRSTFRRTSLFPSFRKGNLLFTRGQASPLRHIVEGGAIQARDRRYRGRRTMSSVPMFHRKARQFKGSDGRYHTRSEPPRSVTTTRGYMRGRVRCAVPQRVHQASGRYSVDMRDTHRSHGGHTRRGSRRFMVRCVSSQREDDMLVNLRNYRNTTSTKVFRPMPRKGGRRHRGRRRRARGGLSTHL